MNDSMDDPKYQIAPGIFNFTAWSRENIPKGEPRFKVGQKVRFIEPLYIHHVGQDCDGTPLFAVTLDEETDEERASKRCVLFSGFSADSFEAIE